MRRVLPLSLAALFLASSALVFAQETPAGWSTIKGQIVYAGATIPEAAKLDVNKNEDHCLAKGPILSEKWVVNPKNKGVGYVVVYLKADKGGALPLHDSLKAPAGKVEVDQPCCKFEPRVVALREGQKLVAKNSSPISHNVEIIGFKNSRNSTLPAGQAQEFDLEMEPYPIQMRCGIHPWMSGYLWVFDHPYHAVTDADGNFEIKLAPAGTRNLVVWQESMGWLGGKDGRNGKPITINASGVTDVGKIEIK